MRRLSAAMFAVLGLAVASGSVAQDQAAKKAGTSLFTSITDNQIETILDSSSVKSKKKENGHFQFEYNDMTIDIWNHGKDCQLLIGFDIGGKGDLVTINRWNATTYDASQAYLDGDGDPVLSMDIDFEGGISPGTIDLHIFRFLKALDRFHPEVVRKGLPVTDARAPRSGRIVRRASLRVSPVRQADDEAMISPGLMESALRRKEIEFKERSHKLVDISEKEYVITLGGRPVVAFVSPDAITLECPIPVGEPTLERLNEWNREKRFCRAYLERTGVPVLASTLQGPFASRSSVEQFLDVYESSLANFRKYVKARP